MSEDYTFLRNDQLKNMQDELESARAHIAILQDTINTLDYQLEVYKLAYTKYIASKLRWSSKWMRDIVGGHWLCIANKELQKVREQNDDKMD